MKGKHPIPKISIIVKMPHHNGKYKKRTCYVNPTDSFFHAFSTHVPYVFWYNWDR